MQIPADIRYTEEMLREAMDMLAGLERTMGMFQRQYYGKLKKRFEQHESLHEDLRAKLNEIVTSDEIGGGLCCG